MKFVRFGPLTPQKQMHYKEPKTGMWPCNPPCKKGFFAFPAGYMDTFYLPLSRPPEDPHSLRQYFRDENGEKITRKAFYRKNTEAAERIANYAEELKFSNWGRNLKLPKGDNDWFFRMVARDKLYPNGEDEPTVAPEIQALLKKRKLKEYQILWVQRPSYIMYFPDPKKDLTFYGLGTDREDRTRLSQPLEFLIDPFGEKIKPANYISSGYYMGAFPSLFEGGFRAPDPKKDYMSHSSVYFPDKKSVPFLKWLKMKHISPDQICVWPCYPEEEDEYATTLKKYHVFDYDGCLWHHLGEFLKPGEILSRFADTWVYTDMHAYERALKKSNGTAYQRNMKYQRNMTRPGYFGTQTWNGTFDLSTMYEVFFDEKIH